MSVAAAHALCRFGYGAKPGDIVEIASDPRSWALTQFDGRPTALRVASAPAAMAPLMRAMANKDKNEAKAMRKSSRQALRNTLDAQLKRAASAEDAAVERWVAFWVNHFTVAAKNPPIAAALPGFEKDAIRPHALGRFRDLLGAVAAHPAMLLYLDQAQSIGPNTRIGQRRKRGLNENFARELLELHTLGVDGGYDQADVRALAEILTGWSVGRPKDKRPGAFIFRDAAHEPGAKTLLGRRIADGGRDQGEAALDLLAAHPSTARNVARALARHYIADDPPAAAIETLARRFRETDGDLRAMARTLVRLDAAWVEPGAKARRPFDYVVGLMRATGAAPPGGRVFGALRTMGQTPFRAPSPKGWPDEAAHWLGPEGVMRRIELAELLARRIKRADPLATLDAAFGDAADPVTRFHVANAGEHAEGVAVALASPEMMRR